MFIKTILKIYIAVAVLIGMIDNVIILVSAIFLMNGLGIYDGEGIYVLREAFITMPSLFCVVPISIVGFLLGISILLNLEEKKKQSLSNAVKIILLFLLEIVALMLFPKGLIYQTLFMLLGGSWTWTTLIGLVLGGMTIPLTLINLVWSIFVPVLMLIWFNKKERFIVSSERKKIKGNKVLLIMGGLLMLAALGISLVGFILAQDPNPGLITASRKANIKPYGISNRINYRWNLSVKYYPPKSEIKGVMAVKSQNIVEPTFLLVVEEGKSGAFDLTDLIKNNSPQVQKINVHGQQVDLYTFNLHDPKTYPDSGKLFVLWNTGSGTDVLILGSTGKWPARAVIEEILNDLKPIN